MAFDRLVRFVPRGGDESAVLIGQPVDSNLDVGLAIRQGQDVEVEIFSGSSVLEPGEATSRRELILKLLSPLSAAEVGTIRCIGLNYRLHAVENKMAIPKVPILFLKPHTSLADPWPAPTIIPKHTLADDTADYESELAVVLGRTAKNVSEADALDYVLGYTACNDVSSRKAQLEQPQYDYSKGFDSACPIGPVLVSTKIIPDPSKLTVRGLKNGNVMQKSGTDDLIFNVPKLISFLSQGTTLPAGTIILSGTPSGVGHFRRPTEYLHDGDEFVVEILPHIGSLVNVIKAEV